MDKQVESTYNIDFSGLKAPMITVYKSPKDYPGVFVARIWDALNGPTDTVIIRKNLEELQDDILQNTGMLFIPRDKRDDPVIVGAWV